MRQIALVVALFFIPAIAEAQLSGPLMKAGATGTRVTPSAPFWWFAGTVAGDVSCAYDSTTASDKCTFKGGSSATLQTAYNASAGANPSILETVANGAVTILGPGVANGTLFVVKDGPTTTTLLGIQDNGTNSLDSIAALHIGTTTATGINYGNGTITHAFTGSLTDNTVASTYTHSAADNFGTTPTAYMTLENTTAAANNAQQFSPFITLQGRGWETTGNSSQTVGWRMGVRPVQGTTNFPDLVVERSTGGAYTEKFHFGKYPNLNYEGLWFNTDPTTTGGIASNGPNVYLFSNGNVIAAALVSSLDLEPGVSLTTEVGSGSFDFSNATGSFKTTQGTVGLGAGTAAVNTFFGANSTVTATPAAAGTNVGFSWTHTGGAGGAATAGAAGGAGGLISVTAGTGGADSAAHSGGNGGALTEQAGTGGAATTNSAGAGGVASLIGGTGGANTAAGGGAGGAVNITGGAGGSSAIFTGANGGAVNISGGTPGGNGNTGAINLQTNTVLSANVNLSTTAGTTAVDFSNGTGIFKTTTGASTFGGSSNNFTNTITLSANAGISTTAGTGAFDFSNGTGVFKTSTGTVTLGAGTSAVNTSYGANSTVSGATAGTGATGFSWTETGSQGGATSGAGNAPGGVGGAISITSGIGGSGDGVAGDTGGNSGTLTIKTGAGGTALVAVNPGNSGILTIKTGDGGTGGSGNSNSGNVVLDVGAKQGTGTAGTVSLGGTNASAISIGNNTIVSTVTGVLEVSASDAGGASTSKIVPIVHNAPVNQAIEVGSSGMTNGTVAVTFNPAFNGVPICVCTVSSGTPQAQTLKCPATSTTLTITSTVTTGNSDTVSWNCLGAR